MRVYNGAFLRGEASRGLVGVVTIRHVRYKRLSTENLTSKAWTKKHCLASLRIVEAHRLQRIDRMHAVSRRVGANLQGRRAQLKGMLRPAR